MSKDNLILFPNKSKSIVGMSEKELRWTISGTLLMILALSVGLNSAIFKKGNSTSVAGHASSSQQRGVAMDITAPIFKISWEKRAFEILDGIDHRELASVGSDPSNLDNLSFGLLEGLYAIKLSEGKILQIEFASTSNSKPKHVNDRHHFLMKYQALFPQSFARVEKTHGETNGQVHIEKYQLRDGSGDSVGAVQFVLDDRERLISMVVQ